MAYQSLTIIKNVLDIPADNTNSDDYLTFLLNGASQRIDQHCDRTFILAQGIQTARVFRIDEHPPYQVDDMVDEPMAVECSRHPRGPWTELNDWYVEPLNPAPIHGSGPPGEELLMPYDTIAVHEGYDDYEYLYASGYGIDDWSRRSRMRFLRVTADWGWPIVPPDVAESCLRLAHRYFALPGAPLGATAAQTEVGPIFVRSRDADVATLLRPYRKTADSLL